jgi:hypothetical protein
MGHILIGDGNRRMSVIDHDPALCAENNHEREAVAEARGECQRGNGNERRDGEKRSPQRDALAIQVSVH